MAEADAVGLHYPVDGRPACVACPEAVPEVLRRSDDKRRIAVVVEGSISAVKLPTGIASPTEQ